MDTKDKVYTKKSYDSFSLEMPLSVAWQSMKLLYMYLKPKIWIVQCHSPLIYACLAYPNHHKQYPRNGQGTWFVIDVIIPFSPKGKDSFSFFLLVFFFFRINWNGSGRQRRVILLQRSSHHF